MGHSIRPVGLIVLVVIALWRSVDRYLNQRESAAIVRRDAELKIGITDTVPVIERNVRRHHAIRLVVRTLVIAALLGIASLYFVGGLSSRW